MGLSKTEKFDALNEMPNVFQTFSFKEPHIRNFEGNLVDLKGLWAERYFQNDNSIVLDLACGRGEYTVGLARMHPNNNYIGIDLKGNRIWTGANDALESGLKNVAFFRTKIELLDHFFSKDEINSIWITFPDPFLNQTKANRRLTSPYFLDIYRKVCDMDAVIHLKTDSPELYHYTQNIIAEQHLPLLIDIPNIYHNGIPEGPLSIRTYYEGLHLENDRTIRYLEFKLNQVK